VWCSRRCVHSIETVHSRPFTLSLTWEGNSLFCFSILKSFGKILNTVFQPEDLLFSREKIRRCEKFVFYWKMAIKISLLGRYFWYVRHFKYGVTRSKHTLLIIYLSDFKRKWNIYIYTYISRTKNKYSCIFLLFILDENELSTNENFNTANR